MRKPFSVRFSDEEEELLDKIGARLGENKRAALIRKLMYLAADTLSITPNRAQTERFKDKILSTTGRIEEGKE